MAHSKRINTAMNRIGVADGRMDRVTRIPIYEIHSDDQYR